MIPTLTRDRDTVEYLTYRFDTFTDDTGASVAPPTTYDLAAVPAGTRPADGDWHPAPWLAGPLPPGLYDVYVRFTDSPEVPVTRVGLLTVT